MKRILLLIMIVCLMTFAWGERQSHKHPQQTGPCCLCMCNSIDQSKCSRMCINFQHGEKIVNEAGIDACTKSCAQHKVPTEKSIR